MGALLALSGTEGSATDRQTGKPLDTDSPESRKLSEAARSFFREDLAFNRDEAEAFQDMRSELEVFAEAAGVVVVVCKCMDGRVQTNKHKGLPPTFAENFRCHGDKKETSRSNRELWEMINKAKFKADSQGKPLVIICAGHFAVIGSGCAAHKELYDRKEAYAEDRPRKDPLGRPIPTPADLRAHANANTQADKLSAEFRNRKERRGHPSDEEMEEHPPIIIPAMTNTDTGAMQLFLEQNGTLFDAGSIIGQYETPSSIFTKAFLRKKIGPPAHTVLHGKTLEELLDNDGPYFHDQRVSTAVQRYLMEAIRASGDSPGKGIVFGKLADAFNTIPQYAEAARPFLAYMMLANVIHAVNSSNINAPLLAQHTGKDMPEALRKRVSHDERVLGYGKGFDLKQWNSIILVKHGGGNDPESLKIALTVLRNNLRELKLEGELPPLVHVNVELDHPINSPQDYADMIGRMNTKLGLIEDVFQEFESETGVFPRILTTYSYHETVPRGNIGCPTKQFIPVNPDPGNPRIVLGSELDLGLKFRGGKFTPAALRQLEDQYSKSGSIASQRIPTASNPSKPAKTQKKSK